MMTDLIISGYAEEAAPWLTELQKVQRGPVRIRSSLAYKPISSDPRDTWQDSLGSVIYEEASYYV